MILDLVIKLLLYFCAVASFFMFLPGTILLDIEPRAFHSALPKSLDKFTTIESINVTVFEQIGPLAGPESIATFESRLVTGSRDGWLYEIEPDDTFKPLLKVVDTQECQKQDARFPGPKCGRPLGLKFDSKGALFVVEPAHGVFRVDNVFGKSPKVSLVFDIEQTNVLGKTSKFLDDLAIEEKTNGGPILYISDVSTKFSIEEFILIVFGSENGRIIRYDTDTKKVDLIANDIFFPNGIELTANKEALLFTETASRNVWRYELKGAAQGTLRKIVQHLPGEPDNIRASVNGKTFWVSILKPRTLVHPSEFDYYIRKPLLRKLVGRVAHLAGSILLPMGQLLHNDKLTELGYSLRTLMIALPTLFPSEGGMMLEIDDEGNVISSVLSDQANLGLMSEVREVPSPQSNQRVFYLGSFALSHLRKLTISN